MKDKNWIKNLFNMRCDELNLNGFKNKFTNPFVWESWCRM